MVLSWPSLAIGHHGDDASHDTKASVAWRQQHLSISASLDSCGRRSSSGYAQGARGAGCRCEQVDRGGLPRGGTGVRGVIWDDCMCVRVRVCASACVCVPWLDQTLTFTGVQAERQCTGRPQHGGRPGPRIDRKLWFCALTSTQVRQHFVSAWW